MADSPPWTVRRVLAWIGERLATEAVASARLDAELLVAFALGSDRLGLYLALDKPLEVAELERIRSLTRRRLAGEPVAYLTGEKEFWSLPLRVDRRVLVPRPETEHLVEEALARLDAPPPVSGPIVDVGTGSGAVALALARERPERHVVGVDLSEDALAVAAENGARLGLAVEWRRGDLLDAVRDLAPLALVAGNLPYVAEGDVAALALARHEPAGALFAGREGLDLIARLVAEASPLLAAGGALALEIGFGQALAVRALLTRAGFEAITVRRDLSGIERIVAGRRAPAASSAQ